MVVVVVMEMVFLLSIVILLVVMMETMEQIEESGSSKGDGGLRLKSRDGSGGGDANSNSCGVVVGGEKQWWSWLLFLVCGLGGPSPRSADDTREVCCSGGCGTKEFLKKEDGEVMYWLGWRTQFIIPEEQG